MSTFWVLIAVSGLLTYFYFKQKWNVLMAIVTAFSWLGLMVYNIAYPPTNIVAGSFLHQLLILVFLGVAVTILYMWFRNRDNKFSDTGKSEFTEDEERERNPNNKGIMDMGENGYKAYLKNRRPQARR